MVASEQHRYFYCLIGSAKARLAAFLRLADVLQQPFLVTHQPETSAFVDEIHAHKLIALPFNKLSMQLGHTTQAILFDVEQGMNANALAIAAGCVCGGGLFAIGLPDTETWLESADADLARHLPWPLQPHEVTSYFKRHFLQHLQDDPHLIWVQGDDELDHLTSLPRLALPVNTTHLCLSEAQKALQDAILHHQQHHLTSRLFLRAPRGRGKSTLLGHLCAKWQQVGMRVAVTAPRKAAVDTLYYHYQTQQPNTDLAFYAPDVLIHSPIEVDVLIIDEAAALPLPRLLALHQQYHQSTLLFSTTEQGYEGGGKGFSLRFLQQLTKAVPEQLRSFHLQQPIRWCENDPLETWISQCLLFTAPSSQLQTSLEGTHSLYGRNWLTHAAVLAQSFQLLLQAHYQTTPDDLRWLLDDPSVCSWVHIQAKQVYCVAIVTAEGPLDHAMASAVMEGKRRPRGHLLPQSLLAHEGWLEAADYRYWRISRIATLTEQQRQGYASRLLQAIESDAQQKDVDFLCCSFAMTTDTLCFWLQNGFLPIRLGSRRDQASGTYSIMMVKAMHSRAAQQASQWHARFQTDTVLHVMLYYPDLDIELKRLLLQCYPILTCSHQERCLIALSEHVQPQDVIALKLFIQHSRPFTSIRAPLTRVILTLARFGVLMPHHSDDYLLLQTALAEIDENRHPFESKKRFLHTLKARLAYWLVASPRATI